MKKRIAPAVAVVALASGMLFQTAPASHATTCDEWVKFGGEFVSIAKDGYATRDLSSLVYGVSKLVKVAAYMANDGCGSTAA